MFPPNRGPLPEPIAFPKFRAPGGVEEQTLRLLIRESYSVDDAAPITTPLNGITYQRADLWEITGGVAQTTAAATTGALPIAYGTNGFARTTGLAMAARVLQNPQGPGPNETISPGVGWSTAPGAISAVQLSGLYFWSVVGQFAAMEVGQSAVPFLLDANAVSTYYDLVHILRSTGSFSIAGDRLAFVHKQGNSATMYPSVGQTALNRHPASIDYFNVAQLGGGWLDDYGLATTRLAGARSVNDLFTHEANRFWCEFMLTTTPSAGSVLIDIRRQDANNKWQLEVVASNGAFNLIEVVAGTPTQRAQITANTSGDRLMCVMDGSQARLIRWRSGAATQSSIYSSVSTFTTQTQGELISLGTGGAVSDIETYPRVIPTALYQWILALRAA